MSFEVSLKSTAINTLPIEPKIILEQNQFDLFLTELKKVKEFAVDTETTDLDPHKAKLVGLSFSWGKEHSYYLPFNHRYLGSPTQLNQDFCLQELREVFLNPEILKILQHAKFDFNILRASGIKIINFIDTQLMAYVLQSHERNDLNSLSKKYLHHVPISFEEVAGKGSKQITFDQVEINQAAAYAAEDAWVTYELAQIFSEKLNQEPALRNLLTTLEFPLVPILADMEYYGVLIDKNCLAQQSQALEKHLFILQEQAYRLADQVFNLNSPKQLQEILFGKLNLPVMQKTPTGQASTSEEVLQDLSYEYELPSIILTYRSLSKLKSTYTDRLPEKISPKTGRIHTSYHQAIVPTGRLSSSDPNLQNIPIRSEEGRKIRQAFIAPPGYKILAADYSQVELRIMAHLSQDKNLLAAFHANEDIHRATASEIFSVPLDQVSVDQRRHAKAINFGLMYGMSAFGLAKQLHISREAAQEYIHIYFERYPGVKNYMDHTRKMAHEKGYVETLYGRRLYLTEINSRQMMRVKAAERAAINAPLQGTSADIIKKAMIDIAHWLKCEPTLGINMIMQVHDELLFEVPETQLLSAKQNIIYLMEKAVILSVPLLVDIKVGNNWGEAE